MDAVDAHGRGRIGKCGCNGSVRAGLFMAGLRDDEARQHTSRCSVLGGLPKEGASGRFFCILPDVSRVRARPVFQSSTLTMKKV